jgi:hypothetical protein
MTETTRMTTVIDHKNDQFTSRVKDQLKDLGGLSDDALGWLMLEHYQFSAANPGFLAAAAATTGRLANKGISAELQRNFEEESGHAAIYKKGLSEIGSDVAHRVEFRPTTEFLDTIAKLTTGGASTALGALYATETAAIFEHEVFWSISREVCARRGRDWDASTIKAFHDMHLDGVEQSHKDELGVFVDQVAGDPGDGGDGESIDRAEVLGGAQQAIDAMRVWWTELVEYANRR